MTSTTDNASLSEIGTNALASVLALVAALECDYDRLNELRESADSPEEIEELKALEEAASGCDVNYPCDDRDDAEQRIHEDALSVQVRSDWHNVGDDAELAEYCILLTTGGPAVRIIGELRDGEPHSAILQVQDWGTPWTEHVTTGDEHKALLAYAGCFFFEC